MSRKGKGEQDDHLMKNPVIVKEIEGFLTAMKSAATQYQKGCDLNGKQRMIKTEAGPDLPDIPTGDGGKRVDVFIAEIDKLKTETTDPVRLIKAIALLDSVISSSSGVLKSMLCDPRSTVAMVLTDHQITDERAVLKSEHVVEVTRKVDDVATVKAAVNCYRASLSGNDAATFTHFRKINDEKINPPSGVQKFVGFVSSLFGAKKQGSTGTASSHTPQGPKT